MKEKVVSRREEGNCGTGKCPVFIYAAEVVRGWKKGRTAGSVTEKGNLRQSQGSVGGVEVLALEKQSKD